MPWIVAVVAHFQSGKRKRLLDLLVQIFFLLANNRSLKTYTQNKAHYNHFDSFLTWTLSGIKAACNES